MRMILALLTPALLLGSAAFALAPAPGAPAPPPVAEVSPPPPANPVAARGPTPPAATTTRDASPVDSTADREAPDRPEREADALLRSIRGWIDADLDSMPENLMREIAAFLDRFPRAAETFLAALDGSGQRMWEILGGAFALVTDPDLRGRLLRTQRSRDPAKIRLERALADRTRAMAALDDREDPGLRLRIIDSLPDEQLADPEFFERIRWIATQDPDPKTRQRALYRLARSSREEARALLADMLEDPSRPLSERGTIAMGFGQQSSPDIRDCFVRILRAGDSTAMLANAAGGLTRYVGQPEVAGTLLDVAGRDTTPDLVRRRALTALANGLKGAAPEVRDAILVRARGLIGDLAGHESSQEILVHALAEFCRSVGEPFSSEAREIAARAESKGLRDLLYSNASLRPVLEN